MVAKQLRKTCMIVLIACALAACGATTAALPTAPALTMAPAPTSIPQPTKAPTSVPAATEQPVIQTQSTPISVTTSTPTRASAALPISEGQVILQLSAGAAANQVGMVDGGPRAFRIGGDGSLRVLDNANKRVLIFRQDGQRERTIPIAEAQDPIDFIINTQAEIYVFDRGAAQVLHYGKDNALIDRFAVNADVANAADGVMLSSDQDVYLVQQNETY